MIRMLLILVVSLPVLSLAGKELWQDPRGAPLPITKGAIPPSPVTTRCLACVPVYEAALAVRSSKPKEKAMPNALSDAAVEHGESLSVLLRFADLYSKPFDDQNNLRGKEDEFSKQVRLDNIWRTIHGRAMMAKARCEELEKSIGPDILRAAIDPWFETVSAQKGQLARFNDATTKQAEAAIEAAESFEKAYPEQASLINRVEPWRNAWDATGKHMEAINTGLRELEKGSDTKDLTEANVKNHLKLAASLVEMADQHGVSATRKETAVRLACQSLCKRLLPERLPLDSKVILLHGWEDLKGTLHDRAMVRIIWKKKDSRDPLGDGTRKDPPDEFRLRETMASRSTVSHFALVMDANASYGGIRPTPRSVAIRHYNGMVAQIQKEHPTWSVEAIGKLHKACESHKGNLGPIWIAIQGLQEKASKAPRFYQ